MPSRPDMEDSRQVAEAAREREWTGAGFLRDLFLGRFRIDLIHPFPTSPERPAFQSFYERFHRFLMDDVDPAEIDETGEYPPEVLAGLRALGAFGMKIPKAYGGLGLTQVEYGKVMQLLGSYDGNLTALLSAHQSIGVPQPLKLFGTEAQKRAFLPRCAAGAISAFALTEPAVGSDPARLSTTAIPTADGSAFILNGEKLWCTNGTLAELLVVMARNPQTNAISAFVVETSWPGVEITRRCRFMGLRALANAAIRFDSVRVPRENLIGQEGKGLKIALTTLNTGRLTLPAATVGTAKQCLEICRTWSLAREQWGQPIGKHEAIAHKLASMAETTFAMESVAELAEQLADHHGYDIRLEAAAAKEWNTVQTWRIADETLQIRGGRGYETERSLSERGEPPIGVERMMRDTRINLIFEGSSEIMHLFMAREAVDKHLQVAGALIDPKATPKQKLRALPKVFAFYVSWYIGLWLGWSFWPRFRRFGESARHFRFIETMTRKLARSIFYGMLVFRAGLERKQAFLFRAVDIAQELFAMSASLSRAEQLRAQESPHAPEALMLARQFCANRRRPIRALFRSLWRSRDAQRYALGRDVLEGKLAWLEQGAMGLHLSVDALRPRGTRVDVPRVPVEEALM